jgi:4-aminobutyrate aminotransferase-like enzyme/Ser/Thr protein kinase RdoA (MazF antagonist)
MIQQKRRQSNSLPILLATGSNGRIIDTMDKRPQFSAQTASRLAREHYGLTAVSITPLPSDRDQNFLLRTGSDERYVLKLAQAGEDEGVLRLQQAVLQHLHANWPDEAVPLPQVRPTTNGNLLLKVTDDSSNDHYLHLLTYLPGRPLGDLSYHPPQLLHQIGRLLAQVNTILLTFDHPAARRKLHWDLDQAPAVIARHQRRISDPARRALLAACLADYERWVTPHLPHLRRSLIHGDANDYNLLVDNGQLTGLIDLGDVIHSATVYEPAIAAAYALLHKADPLAAACTVTAGYHELLPLTETEISLLFTLIRLRLCQSVAMSAYQQTLEPDNDYLVISQQPAWQALEKLAAIPPNLAHYRLRHACGLPPCPRTGAICRWLEKNQTGFSPIVVPDLSRALLFDLSIGSPLTVPRLDGTDLAERLRRELGQAGAETGIGLYDEARPIYTAPEFQQPDGEWRTVHCGLDIFLPAGSPLYAPLPGRVHSVANHRAPLDYGPTLILVHETADGLPFYTLYGHLGAEILEYLKPGMAVKQGELIGLVGDTAVNGSWPPHLHFQIITDLLGYPDTFPGVAPASQRAVWLSLSPDPGLIVSIPAAPQKMDTAVIHQKRSRHLPPMLSLSYQEPLHIVRGQGQYLYDVTGRPYLDMVNNVAHVGHNHPRVVEALHRQALVLNTNTRYLHETIVTYAERLLATLPEPLSVCFFVNSGSEANDLALRLARAHTGRRDLVVVDGAYHGHLTSLIEISPYKFNGPGGQGAPDHVHVSPMPDPYRCRLGSDGSLYAQEVVQIVEKMAHEGKKPAAFICESLLSCGGQIVLPEGYLAAVYDTIRASGGVTVADEVQVGLGRVGSHFWGFQTQAIVPDIVTMGKPMGNGHPLAAVVTTPEIAASFDTGMEYFNTYGGNPVSCVVGSAVLDVIEEEELQAHAAEIGRYLLDKLAALKEAHSLIGDVRGRGLFLGIELVNDRETMAPAAPEARTIVERMKEEGILLSTDGPLHNVIKIKPPLPFNQENADFFVEKLTAVLS